MINTMRKKLIVSLVIALALPSAAQAASIHEPAEGHSAEIETGVYFDWRWDSDEYASTLVFTQNSDPDADIWLGGDKPGKVRVSDQYGPFLESHATVYLYSQRGFTPGTWYWRICSRSVNGEDDRCYYDADVPPRALNISPAPAPPAKPQCSDGVDNDGDAGIDHPDASFQSQHDSECFGPADPSEHGDCADGIDNDGDGLVDANDPPCESGDKEIQRPTVSRFRQSWTQGRVYKRIGRFGIRTLYANASFRICARPGLVKVRIRERKFLAGFPEGAAQRAHVWTIAHNRQCVRYRKKWRLTQSFFGVGTYELKVVVRDETNQTSTPRYTKHFTGD